MTEVQLSTEHTNHRGVGKFQVLWERFWVFLSKLLDAFLRYEKEGRHHWVAWLALGVLFILGSCLWYYFLNGGAVPLNLHDWIEAAHRYTFLKDAVTKGELPLHMPGNWALRGVTLRFLTVVDTNISPQVLLLRFLKVGEFVLVNTLLLYTLGFIGLVLLRKKLKLSLLITCAVYFLLFFNGHISDHLAVGHTHWAAYLLSPYLILVVLELLEGRKDWWFVSLASFFLFVIFLQGAYHLFVICILFLVILLLAELRLFKPILQIIFFSLLLSMVRILPVLVDYGKFDTGFYTGFVTTLELLRGLFELRIPFPEQVYSNFPTNPLGWWEFDYFIGALGVLAVGAFALHFFIRPPNDRKQLIALALPIIALTVLSIGRIYKVLHFLQIPLLSTQRVSSRLFFLPLIFLIILAAIALQRILDRRQLNFWLKMGLIGVVLVMIHDIWQHFNSQRVPCCLWSSEWLLLSIDLSKEQPIESF